MTKNNVGYKRALISGDYSTALKEIRPLAQKGDPMAQYNLGLMYDKGLGVLEMCFEAAKWFQCAAKQGHVRAQLNLGNMCYEGRGATKNFQEAAKWFEQAAKQGNAEAQLNLGSMYMIGEGVEQNNMEAYFWFSLAAAQGKNHALKFKKLVEQSLSPEEIAQVNESLAAFKRQSKSC